MKRLLGKAKRLIPGTRPKAPKATPQVRGHVAEMKRRLDADAAQRKAAQNILSPAMARGQDWDAARVLKTTLGGKLRDLQREDLVSFRQAMREVQGRVSGGITARQVIDLAEGHPLSYVGGKPSAGDLGKARTQIGWARAVSSVAGPAGALDVRFLTPSGGETPGVSTHHVVVRFLGFPESLRRLSATPADAGSAKAEKALTVAQAAKLVRSGRLALDCTCGRWRFFFRCLASIGGYSAGRQETGYPKIRNPGLSGIACKHILRTMRWVLSCKP